MGVFYGYHRTSTKEQHLDRGITEITKFANGQGLELAEIFTDQQTGKNFNRPEYTFMKKRCLSGDTIIITEMDRLGRNKKAILDELQYYKEKNVRIMILEIPTTLMSFSTVDSGVATMMLEAINNMLIEMFASLAHAEMEKREKRQAEGIAEKKVRGEWNEYGRPRSLSMGEFLYEYENVLARAITGAECQKRLGISSSTYYRYVREYNDCIQKKNLYWLD